jgi:ribosomal protein L30/L7E
MKQFEDLELSLRLRRHGRMVLAPATVISSGRRFETRGPVRQTMEDFLLTLRFLLLRKRNHAVIGE